MKLKEISKDIYDVSALLDEVLGKEGTPEREKSCEKAWEEYNAQILLDARKNARLTQAELAKRIGADKGYISRIQVCILLIINVLEFPACGNACFLT